MSKLKHFWTVSVVLPLAAALMPVAALAESAQCQGARAIGQPCDANALTVPLDTIINVIFFLAGAIAVIVIIIGGLNYITSEGDSTKTANARNTILNAVIGLAIIIMARAIVAFVAGRFGQ